MPLVVKSVLSKWALIVISLVFTFAVKALEWVRTQFPFLGFESWGV